MARADYVWVVQRPTGPMAAFTVKRELLAWLDRQPPWSFVNPMDAWDVYRLRDGGRDEAVHLGTAAALLEASR